MTAFTRILAAGLALATQLLAQPLVHLGHTHGRHEACAHASCHADRHTCEHDHDHDHDDGPAHESSPEHGRHGEQGDAPARHDDCSLCQAVAMHAAEATDADAATSSPVCTHLKLPTPPVTVRPVLRAYHERGPPVA